jgi:hypothetical protein
LRRDRARHVRRSVRSAKPTAWRSVAIYRILTPRSVFWFTHELQAIDVPFAEKRRPVLGDQRATLAVWKHEPEYASFDGQPDLKSVLKPVRASAVGDERDRIVHGPECFGPIVPAERMGAAPDL